MSKQGAIMVAGFAAAALALAGCGVSVAAGQQNAATHPASGIFVSPTVGAGNTSGHPIPTLPYKPPPSTPPLSLPSGLSSTETAIEAAVKTGCWEDSHSGNVYGAYDQLFWWQGQCSDTVAGMDVELYPTVADANAQLHHASPMPLSARFHDGAVIVDVYANAPLLVLSEVSGVKGLVAVPGYGT